MDASRAASEFQALFHRTFLRFHVRLAADERALSIEAVAVLEHLDRSGPLTVLEAARHFGRSQAATSEIVARLHRRGLLVRFEDERDRRRKLLWLSPEGVEALSRSRHVLSSELLTHAFEGVPPSTRAELLEAFTRFLGTATEARSEGEPGPSPANRERNERDES